METVQHENKQCIIEFQAFRDNGDKFIIKELVVLDLTTNIPYSFIFKPPYSLNFCNSKSRKTNSWLSNHYHHINWYDGNIDYVECENVMKLFCNQFQTIYTTGTEKCKWISSFTNSLVVDLRFPKQCQFTDVLPICLNIKNPKHKASNCSLAKVYKVSSQLKQYPLLEVVGDKGIGGGSCYLSGEAGVFLSVQL